MIFSLNIFPEKQDEDFTRHIKPSCLFQYMMRAANHQFITYGPSHEELLKQDMFFVVSTMDVVLTKPIAPYTELVASTAGLFGRGVIFPRYFELKSGDEVVARALGNFALLSLSDKKLLKQDAFKANWDFEPNDIDLSLERPRIPKIEDMNCLGTYDVTYTQVDQNKHLNNTYYPDMFFGFTSMDKWPSRIFIHFIKEAKMGDTLTIYGSHEENTYTFRATFPDGTVCSECLLELEEYT